MQTLHDIAKQVLVIIVRYFIWVDQNVPVVLLVVVVIEEHCSSFERVVVYLLLKLALGRLQLVLVDLLDPDALFEQMSRLNDCFAEQSSVVLNFHDSHHVFIGLLVGLEIWVPLAVLDTMPDFLAAHALHMFELPLLILLLLLSILFVLVVLALVFGDLASNLVLAPLSAAPVELAVELVVMSAARPVEVLLLEVLLVAVLAYLYVSIVFALFKRHLHDSIL